MAIYDLGLRFEAAEENQKLKVKVQNCGVASRACFAEPEAAQVRPKTKDDRGQRAADRQKKEGRKCWQL